MYILYTSPKTKCVGRNAGEGVGRNAGGSRQAVFKQFIRQGSSGGDSGGR